MSKKPLDVHLMILEPEKYIDAFRTAGAHMITVHYEACTHIHRVLHMIKETGAKAGIAINPGTPVHLLRDLMHEVDLICCMSVNPGFGGQKFIPRSLKKIQQLAHLREEENARCLIEVDGGVTMQNAEAILRAGADVLVAGNCVFSAQDPFLIIQGLKSMSPDVHLV
jgi:ribulose-phosphate 3-epimerase